MGRLKSCPASCVLRYRNQSVDLVLLSRRRYQPQQCFFGPRREFARERARRPIIELAPASRQAAARLRGATTKTSLISSRPCAAHPRRAEQTFPVSNLARGVGSTSVVEPQAVRDIRLPSARRGIGPWTKCDRRAFAERRIAQPCLDRRPPPPRRPTRRSASRQNDSMSTPACHVAPAGVAFSRMMAL